MVEIIKGDITTLELDCIVNAANNTLQVVAVLTEPFIELQELNYIKSAENQVVAKLDKQKLLVDIICLQNM